MQIFKRSFFFFLLCCANIQRVDAQDIEQVAKATPLTISGVLTATSIYVAPLDSNSLQKHFTYYLSGSLNTTLYGLVSVPFSFAYTNNALTSTLTCPFNRFALSPSYKWIKTYIGFASMSFSPYTMSGREFMGGGVELTPTEIPWRFAAYYGRFNKSQEIDSLHTEAVYRRRGGGLRIAYDNEKIKVGVNVNRAEDVRSSLTFAERDTNHVAPQSNIVGSIDMSIEPMDGLLVSGEYALSIVDPNIDEDVDNYRHKAYKFAVSQTFEKGSLGVTYERVSAMYESFCSYYNTNDFQNITANMSANIADKYNLSADVGYQRDNLSDQEVNTNSQLIYSISLAASSMERLSLSSSVSNVQSYVHIKDILETVTQTNQYQYLDTLSFTELNFSTSHNVSYRWGGEEAACGHSVNGGYTFQRALHEQENCQRYVSNKLSNFNINYQFNHKPTKISSTVGANYNINRTPESETDVLTLCASANTVLWKQLRVSASANYSDVQSTLDSRILNARIALAYTLLKSHVFNLSITALNSSAKSDTEYTLNITYSYSFGKEFFKRTTNNE